MNNPRHNQRGVVLMVSLVLLLMLTILAITAASTSSLQSRMAGNAQDMNQAFQAAESGLSRWIEWFENNPSADPDSVIVTPTLGGGSAHIDKYTEIVQAHCVSSEGSGSLGTGFIHTCYHVTSAASVGSAESTHKFGYMVREGL